jgi:3-deoxy-D-manno-octulosonic-acid transferase
LLTVIRWLYNCLFNVGFAISTPYYFLKMAKRGGWKSGFAQRFGKYDARIKQALTNRDVVWFHAVSVGEANLCIQLIQAIEPRLPLHKIVVSTTTSTGMAELQRRLPNTVTKIYYPIDRRKHILRAMGIIHPEVMVFVEAELWPNMIWSLQRRGIPYYLINARISPRSFRGYRRAGFIFRDIFAGFAGVGVQSESDAERLRRLGCRPEAVHVVGSLKFDAASPMHSGVSSNLPIPSRFDARGLLRQLGVPDDALILVGGSTHAGEEAMLAKLSARLRGQFPKLFLILVPRHHERGGDVGRELTSLGVRFAFRSTVVPSTRYKPGDLECLLVNTTGELKAFYECADLVFVGKSLCARGGQNPIEPAALGKAVVFGPYMENFAEIVAQFLKQGGAVEVRDSAHLEQVTGELLGDPQRRAAMGRAGQSVVANNLGGLEKTVEMIVRAAEEALAAAHADRMNPKEYQ